MEGKRKPKYDIPMEVIDKRTSCSTRLDLVAPAKDLRKGNSTAEDFLPTLELLLRRLILSLQKPLIALKYRFFNWLDKLFEDVEVPWLKIIAIALVAFMAMKKNLSFNFSFNSPFTVISDETKPHHYAQATTFGATESNPYAPLSAAALKDKKSMAYIKEYAPIAKAEMAAFGIPASIKMAQALIESRAGTSRLAVNNNNHFGMKCFSKQCKKGHCTNATDDHHKDFFRKYPSAKESWRAHSNLISRGRYASLQNYGTDYKKWAHGLKKAGYATDKRYAQKLINTIEKFQLYRLDEQ